MLVERYCCGMYKLCADLCSHKTCESLRLQHLMVASSSNAIYVSVTVPNW